MDCNGWRWMLLQTLLGMASVWKHPQSKYFTACFRDHNSRQLRILLGELGEMLKDRPVANNGSIHKVCANALKDYEGVDAPRPKLHNARLIWRLDFAYCVRSSC